MAFSSDSNNYIKKLKTLTQVIRLINDNYVDEVDICRADRNMAVGRPTPYELYTIKKFPMYRGTITKTPVAPGAELCGYSGFSAGGYLQAYYTSDNSTNLDLHNAAQFTLMGWQKITDLGNYSYMVTVYGNSGANEVAGLSIHKTGVGNVGSPYFYTSNVGSLIAGADWRIDDGEWHHVAISKEGTTTRIFLNGVQVVPDFDMGTTSSTNDFYIATMT